MPSALARAVLCWLASANASWSARLMPVVVATFSAVSGIESVPYSFLHRLFGKRQPIVVS
jgi:hypothetical protein